QQTHLIISRLLVLPFRRLKFVSKIYYDKCDLKLVKDLRRKFGNDPVLVVGDWSAPNAKFQEPTRNKGLLRYLKKNGFSIYIINEYKTSTYCPACKYSEMESFKEITNPRPFQRERFPKVLCHGLLRCKNEACLANGKRRLFNRDTAAVLNFRFILTSLRDEGQRPLRFTRLTKRKNTEEGSSREKTRKIQ
ncbi:hypothetical protein CU098_001197, partial [Rhizopus stolonifer]